MFLVLHTHRIFWNWLPAIIPFFKTEKGVEGPEIWWYVEEICWEERFSLLSLGYKCTAGAVDQVYIYIESQEDYVE